MRTLLQNSLFLRTASAIILMPIVLYALIFGFWPFAALIVVALILSLTEWTRMVRHMPQPVLRGILGAVYIMVCFAAFAWLRVIYGPGYTLALMLCIWASDTGAYFAGKFIGGPKLAPSISPKKTWAGFFGGMLSSGAVLAFYVAWLGLFLTDMLTPMGDFRNEMMYIFPQTPLLTVFVIGAMITVTGQIGDLIESWQKRVAGVKDSGNLIPGHGGILDRIDSLLFSAPFFVLAVMIAYG